MGNVNVYLDTSLSEQICILSALFSSPRLSLLLQECPTLMPYSSLLELPHKVDLTRMYGNISALKTKWTRIDLNTLNTAQQVSSPFNGIATIYKTFFIGDCLHARQYHKRCLRQHCCCLYKVVLV